PEHDTLLASRSAEHVGKPPGVKINGVWNRDTESGSPVGTLRLTRPPTTFGTDDKFGSWNARLSTELTVPVSVGAIVPLGNVATSVCVEQVSFRTCSPAGGVTALPPTVALSTPVWTHGPTRIRPP